MHFLYLTQTILNILSVNNPVIIQMLKNLEAQSEAYLGKKLVVLPIVRLGPDTLIEKSVTLTIHSIHISGLGFITSDNKVYNSNLFIASEL